MLAQGKCIGSLNLQQSYQRQLLGSLLHCCLVPINQSRLFLMTAAEVCFAEVKLC